MFWDPFDRNPHPCPIRSGGDLQDHSLKWSILDLFGTSSIDRSIDQSPFLDPKMDHFGVLQYHQFHTNAPSGWSIMSSVNGPKRVHFSPYSIDRSIDQIMLFPITRAREGIYKDPRSLGSDPLRPLGMAIYAAVAMKRGLNDLQNDSFWGCLTWIWTLKWVQLSMRAL